VSLRFSEDTRLAFADELERRDAEAARALDAVERLQREVDELRTHLAAVAAFLASLTAAVEARARDEKAALAARAKAEIGLRNAETAVERAGRKDERIGAERALQEACEEVEAAGRWAAEAEDAVVQLAREADERRAEAARLEARAAELSAHVRDVPTPDPGLDPALEWASRARGALLLEHSALAGERETLVREASELLGSVLGEPLTATAVAGVRGKLESALRTP